MNKVVMQLTAVVENEVSDEDRDDVLESYEAESLEDVTEEMEQTVEAVIAQRVFADADNIAILDVNTEVEE